MFLLSKREIYWKPTDGGLTKPIDEGTADGGATEKVLVLVRSAKKGLVGAKTEGGGAGHAIGLSIEGWETREAEVAWGR